MRTRFHRYLAFALGGLSALLGTAALFLYATFDGARLASELTQFTRERTQRSLSIDGSLTLSLFPHPSVSLPAATLSDSNGELLAIDGAQARIRLLPLLTRRLVVERLDVDGLRLVLRRDRAGALGLDGLLDAPDSREPAAAPVDVDISSLNVHRGQVRWTDGEGRPREVQDLELSSGPLGGGARGHLALSARLVRADAEAIRLAGDADYVWTDAALRLAGCVLKARLPVGGDAPDDGVEMEGRLPQLEISATGVQADKGELGIRLGTARQRGQLALNLAGLKSSAAGTRIERVDGELDWQGPDTAPGTALGGKLTAALHVDGAGERVDLRGLQAGLAYTPAGGQPIKLALQGDAQADLRRGTAAGHLSLEAEGSRVEGGWRLLRLSPLSLNFELDADQLDVDHFRAALAAPLPSTSPPVAANHDQAGDGQGVQLEGLLRVKHLKLGGLHWSEVRLPLKLSGTQLMARGHAAKLYGGSLEGSLNVDLARHQLAYSGYLQNADLAPLLRDATGRAALSGSLNLLLDVQGRGETPPALLASLQGKGRLRFRNGAVGGIDMGAALKDWRQAIQGRQGARRGHRERESTPVGELSASFRLDHGLVHTEDLQARSGMLRVRGVGDLNLPGATVDLRTWVTVLVLPVGPESGLFSLLRGLPLPITVRGPLRQPEWHLAPEGYVR